MLISPWKALVFSPSGRAPLMTRHQVRTKLPKTLPIWGPQTMPSRPSVMQTFCIRWCCLCPPCLVRMPTRAGRTVSRYGPMKSGPTLTQISPMAQDALLLTVAEVFWLRAWAASGKISGRKGARYSMQCFAQSPTSAKALCFTCIAVSFSTSGTTWMKFLCTSTCGPTASCMPSTMPERRSMLAAITSRSGFSNSFGFCSHIFAAFAPARMSRVARSTALGTIGMKDGPRFCAIVERHSNSATIDRSLSATVSNLCTSGSISACTYWGRSRSGPTDSASVPTASYRIRRFLAW
mmetsp:Transcript_39136/g.101162  ORF Transcript_39136/g.101162 Transcript_39136/m.101162 type:complete len:293 (+) Transcript_39136:345-1223(+)